MTIRRLSGTAALLAAQNTRLRKNKGETDTEFVKRIVNAYMDADEVITADERAAKTERQRIGVLMRQFELASGHRFR